MEVKRKKNVKNAPANEKFPLGIYAWRNQRRSMTTTTASSFITEARELLRFHFWFGSLRCSFVISKKRTRKRETIEHRPKHIHCSSRTAHRHPHRTGTHVRQTVFVFNFNCFFHHFLPSIGLHSRFVLHSSSCHFAFGQEKYGECEVMQTFDDSTMPRGVEKSISFVWLLTN